MCFISVWRVIVLMCVSVRLIYNDFLLISEEWRETREQQLCDAEAGKHTSNTPLVIISLQRVFNPNLSDLAAWGESSVLTNTNTHQCVLDVIRQNYYRIMWYKYLPPLCSSLKTSVPDLITLHTFTDWWRTRISVIKQSTILWSNVRLQNKKADQFWNISCVERTYTSLSVSEESTS